MTTENTTTTKAIKTRADLMQWAVDLLREYAPDRYYGKPQREWLVDWGWVTPEGQVTSEAPVQLLGGQAHLTPALAAFLKLDGVKIDKWGKPSWGDASIDSVDVNGVTFKLLPPSGLGHKATHRLKVICPLCGREMTLGKFWLHVDAKH